jgi:prevent-host-death family protein
MVGDWLGMGHAPGQHAACVPSGSLMQNISAHDAKARFGQLLDTARREPVVIERHGRAVAVVLSKDEYD